MRLTLAVSGRGHWVDGMAHVRVSMATDRRREMLLRVKILDRHAYAIGAEFGSPRHIRKPLVARRLVDAPRLLEVVHRHACTPGKAGEGVGLDETDEIQAVATLVHTQGLAFFRDVGGRGAAAVTGGVAGRGTLPVAGLDGDGDRRGRRIERGDMLRTAPGAGEAEAAECHALIRRRRLCLGRALAL